MASIDLSESKITLEHLEGFLYGIQEIENHILMSQDACFEYSISLLSASDVISDKELITNTLLDKIKYNEEITSSIKNNFTINLEINHLVDWRTVLTADLQ